MSKQSKKKQVRIEQILPGKTKIRLSNEKKSMEDLIFLILLFFALLFFFKDDLRGVRTLIWDAADQFYPYLFSASTTYRNWELPLWNPFFFNGYPTFANIQAQTFYPLNFLVFPFTSFTPYIVHLSLIFHYLLAGAFMYILSRNYLGNRVACALAAIVYMLSGFMVGHIEHLTLIEGMAWLPLIFLLLEKALVGEKLFYALLAGFFFGISILAGHPQTSHIISFVLLVHVIYRTTMQYAKQKKRAVFLKSALALIICIITGFMIAAVQIVPTYELVKASTRGGALLFDLAAAGGQLSFMDTIILLLPNYFGSVSGPYWGDVDISQSLLYIGIVPFFLMGLAVLNARKYPDVVYFFLMVIFSLLLSLGEHGFIFRMLFDYLPGFDHFRGPVNTAFVYTFFAALLAGYGFNFLSQSFKKRTLCIYSGIFISLSVMLYFLSPVPPKEIGEAAINHMRSGFAFFVVFIIVSVFILILSVYDPRRRKVYYSLLLLLTFADFYINLSDSVTLGEQASPDAYENEPTIISAIKRDSGIISSNSPGIELDDAEIKQGLFRVYTEPRGAPGTGVFGYQRAMLHRVFMVEGYDPIEMSRHKRLGDVLISGNFENFLKINNVKYFTKSDGKTIKLNKYPNFLPRAFIVANAKFMENDDRVLQELLVFDPLSEVVISGKGKDVTGRSVNIGDTKASITKYTGNEVEIQTHSETDGFLVLSDLYYPGWQATIDEVDYPIMRANYDFRSLSLPKGDHSVIFKFKPASFKLGLTASLVAFFFVGFASFYTLYSKFSKKRHK
jgi:hypothetical protein